MNEIIFDTKGKKNTVYVQIAGEPKKRRVGSFLYETLYVQRDRMKHVMRKFNNSYGFNNYVINNLEGLRYVQVEETSGRKFKVPKEVLLTEGKVHHPDGFDEQIFVPVAVIENYEA